MSAAFVKPSAASIIGTLLAFAVIYFLTFRKQLLETIFININYWYIGIAVVLAPIAVGYCVPKFLDKFPNVFYRLQTYIGIPEILQTAGTYMAVYLLYFTLAPALFVFFYAFLDRFVPFVKDVFKESDRIERGYLTTVAVIAFIAVAVIYNQTNAFYAPHNADRKIINYDVVYTADSGDYYKTNVFGHFGAPENDLRQPLFAVFAVPFAVSADILSRLCFFLPNGYSIFIQVFQITLLAFASILMSRMMCLNGTNKAVFLISFTLSYPVLLFALMVEQYIFALFWLTVFMYTMQHNKQHQNYAVIAAVGSLITTAALGVLFFNRHALNATVKRIVKIAFIFLVFVLVSGQFNKFTLSQVWRYRNFTGLTLSFTDKLYQQCNFIVSCFIKPDTIIDKPFLPNVGDWMCYQLAPVTSLNYFGVVLFVFCILGFVLNYRNHFTQVCLYWITFSFLILCLFGWGTAENGLILYSLYFGWAYFCLVFLAIEKLFAQLPLVKYSIYTAAILTLAIINIPGIDDLIQFGIKYYPT
ncbi:MAG: hypothetical protein LBH00_02470 [Planctomycetaceae bacterium]|nr:hypothetical protein [Planctomycetaceae bacterium]